jgi:hypothetical protein
MHLRASQSVQATVTRDRRSEARPFSTRGTVQAGVRMVNRVRVEQRNRAEDLRCRQEAYRFLLINRDSKFHASMSCVASRVIRGVMTDKDLDDQEHRPAPGTSAPGRPFRPSDLPPEKQTPGQPLREAPRPGVPMPEDEYERLKEDAARRHTPQDVPAQEDEHGD